MTDQRARELWKAITDEMFLAKRSGMTPRELAVFTDRRAVEILLTALADERQLVWEEAAKMAEEKAERSIKGEHLNIPEYNFGYRGGLRGLADEIRLKLYAKAHAGQEG